MRIRSLVETLRSLLRSASVPTLYVGPWRLGHALAEHHPLISVDPRLRRCQKQGKPAIVAETSALPFGPHGFGSIILARQLCDAPPDRRQMLLAIAGDLLDKGGQLLLVEAIGGFFAPHGMRPDPISALLLNAGFEAIEQHWPTSKTVITSGRPGRCAIGAPFTAG